MPIGEMSGVSREERSGGVYAQRGKVRGVQVQRGKVRGFKRKREVCILTSPFTDHHSHLVCIL